MADLQKKLKRLSGNGVVSDAAVSLLMKIVNAMLTFTISIMVARTLGAEGFGIYTVGFAFSSVMAVLVQFGLPNFALRETAKAVKSGDWKTMSRVWQWSNSVAAILSVLLCVIALAGIYFFFSGQASESAISALIALALVPLLAFDNLKSAILRGLGHVRLGQISSMILRPLFLLALIALMLLLQADASPGLVMLLRVFAGVAALAIVVIMLRRESPANMPVVSPGSFKNREWIWASSAMAVTAGMTQATNYADLLILGLFSPMAEVGHYRVATQFAGLLIFGMRAVSIVTAPRFARCGDIGKRHELQQLAITSTRLSLAIAIAAVLVLGLWGDTLLEKSFGAEFRSAYALILVLGVGQVINSLFGPIGMLMNMVGLERQAAKTMVVATIANILLNIVLIPMYGPIGAAISTVLCILLWNIAMWRTLLKTINIRCDPFARSNRLPL